MTVDSELISDSSKIYEVNFWLKINTSSFLLNRYLIAYPMNRYTSHTGKAGRSMKMRLSKALNYKYMLFIFKQIKTKDN